MAEFSKTNELNNALLNPCESVLYFTEINFNKPHYYIIIPTQNSDKCVILTMLTSQIEKRLRYCKDNENYKNSILLIEKEKIDFLTAEISLIDCNRPVIKTKDEILRYENLKIISTKIPREIIKEITKKINKSEQVKPSVKKLIDLSKI